MGIISVVLDTEDVEYDPTVAVSLGLTGDMTVDEVLKRIYSVKELYEAPNPTKAKGEK